MITADCQSDPVPEYENKESPKPRVKVSVVIPTYNRAGFLVEAIKSVLDQTLQDFEIIVVDDGSTDNTSQVMADFSDTRIRYLWQENRGAAAAQNTGIKASIGEYITILGSDDLYLPQNLGKKAELLDSHPEIDLVYSDAYLFDDKTGVDICRFWRDAKSSHHWVDPVREARQPLRTLLYRGCFIMPQATMLRRQVFNTVGYFDESLPTNEDWELFVRILQCFSAEIIDLPLLRLRQHDNKLSDNQDKMYQGAVAAEKKVIQSGTLSGEELKILRQQLFSQHIRYGRRALYNGRETVARQALMASIKINPWHFKQYFYLASCFLGSRKYQIIKSLKRKLQHHSHGHRPLRDTSAIGS
jgi:hypothetical protein